MRICGIFKWKKCINNISKMREHEVCIPQQGIWLKGYYIDTVGRDTKVVKEYITEVALYDTCNYFCMRQAIYIAIFIFII